MSKINRVLFIGSKQQGLRVLKTIYGLSPEVLVGVVTIDDRTDSRTNYKQFVNFCNQESIELTVANNRKESQEIFRSYQADLCIVADWYWLIDESTLNSVPFGFIGIHNSLLPKYRGGSPLVWSVLNKDEYVGFSVFTLTPGMDDGPIWAQGRVKLLEEDYLSTIREKIENKIIDVLEENYLAIIDRKVKPYEQQHHLATYCAQRFPTDGLIDWMKNAHDVRCLIRASAEPNPGAYTYIHGKQLKILKAEVFDCTYYGSPGQVAKIDSERVYVICGENTAIILEVVEFEGEKMHASQIIKSIKVKLGVSNDS
ncbi:methionyl-tRNA formyltransferase [Pseudoalteromonas luteoviolacea]|uniref:Methionyl-tRNA formyltransferase n=1 Tax=Pseudoalteromonas luteoviolacea S4054 TaxID=1129367 RepID=A0A0F6ACM5_9GAMM|nr:methionyl-tRNA formyltransferase [Pseudoalteromonas luteoviolacea]AOT09699.1 hypothetical protein S4054249_18555 [Pseudoalteromonas luteoviolacea]AOT14612.1 hypothetical protein S40542_18525 [Pseudoalteromonas luteoviolacea]AOT19526.1 hypothetical protein S4054_18530 [Pseudoalteromonas luteoviolacea]KKE83967.1 hypothetical protein N479_11180 [Pseudoalteromonas luteoviolacea S4054]KZN77361.1 hypothetical protein N481_04720 [Pseudoalteromonas luteoviolacea S4047-1]